MKRFLYTTIAIIIGTLCGNAQSYKLFSSDHYLSSSLIKHIFQDSDGMLWISTEDGLNRYDGVKFTIYKNIPDDSTSIAANFVNTFFEDSSGRRFVGTNTGIQQYYPDSNSFGPLLKTTDGTPYTSAVSGVIQRKNGENWCLGNDIMRINTHNGSLLLEPLQFTGNSAPIRLIGDGIEDNDGNIWLTRGKYGITRIDSNNRVTEYVDKKNQPNIDNVIIDNKGQIFFSGHRAGLYTYDRSKDRILKIITTPPLNHLTVVDMTQAEDGSILLATDGEGLKRLDTTTYDITDIPFGSDKFDYSTQKAHSVLFDSTGNLWIALFQKGIMLLPPVTNNFHYIGNRSLLHNNIGTKCVIAMLMDDNGHLWVGTDGEGIYNLDKDNGLIKHYTGVPPVAMKLFEDSDKNLWVGSYGHGAGILDRKTGIFHKITLTEQNENGFEANQVYSLAEDRRRNIWIGTMGSGLFRYNHETKKANNCSEWADSLCQWITSLHYSTETDALYIGTYDGLNVVHSPGVKNRIEIPFRNAIINCITATGDGMLWLGTSNGIIRYNPDDGSRKNYSVQDGLPSSTVYGIEEHDNELWISTSMGLARFDMANGTFCNYYIDDGLQGNEFYKGASLKDNNGNLYFGGINGITYFNPKEITVPGKKWHVRIVDVYLHGRPVTSNSMSGNRKVIDSPVYNAERLNLSHSDNSLSVELSTHELNRSGSMQFAYALDDSKWEVLPHNTNIINFNELNPGEHLLRVKAVDNGIESDETTIVIDIAYPWWNAWWMKIIYLAVIACIIVAIWVTVHHRINEKREKMEQKHAEEIYESKLRFFTNISHEIRTPMSLVISPLKKLIETDGDSVRQKEYRLIQRNADRILRLINELMDIRKIDKNQMKLKFSEIEIIPFINDLCETFYPATHSKNISLNFHTNGNEGLKAWVDKANFDKIIMNLLSNAVKYTPDGGAIDIGVNVNGNNDINNGNKYLTISVADTGIGIPEEERRNIFERFYQAGGTHTGGTGVGLHLTCSLVKLHHGTITVDDNKAAGKGSVFTVTLPLGNSHLSTEEIVSIDKSAESDKTAKENKPQPEFNQPQSVEEHQRQKGQKVLVVEDDEEIREYIISELSKYYSITGCSNGREALESIFKAKPDLIISDVMMPETDGLTLTRKIKQNINLNDIPVILLTAKTTEQDNIEGLENGADAYITKPFNIKILQSTVNNLLRSHSRLRNVFSGKQSQGDRLEKVAVDSDDERLMERVMKVINANIGDPNLTVEMLASEVGLSRVHLHRKLKELTNQSPRDFIRNARLQVAAKLLAEKRLCIAEIAYSTGFKNPNNFSTAFKELYGMTPTEYTAGYSRHKN